MAYTTQADILESIKEATLAGLVDDVNTPPNLASANAQTVLNGLIANADAWADDFLRLVTSVPLASPVPPSVEFACRIHVLYHAYLRRQFQGGVNPFFEEYVKQEERLMDISQGRRKVELASGTDIRSSLDVMRSTTDDVDRTFSLEELSGF